MASSSSSSSASLGRLRDLTDDDVGVERGGGHHVPTTSAAAGGYADRDDGPLYRSSGFRPWRGRLSLRDAAAPPGPGAALPPSPPSPTHSRGSSEKTLSDDDRQAPSSAPPVLPPPAAAHHGQPPATAAVPAPLAPQQLLPHVAAVAQPPQREFICSECGKSYPTNQGLGGHMAGHNNKRREAAAAAARAAGGAAAPQQDGGARRRGRKEGPHVCGNCGKEFERGVQLGGHQRAHYTGPPIKPARRNKRRCLAPAPPPPARPEEESTPSPVAPAPPPVIRSEEEEAPWPPAAANVRPVRLFGIDIAHLSTQVEPSSEQRGSRPGSTTAEDS